jgi:2-methylcitrate dehydratase PrpD
MVYDTATVVGVGKAVALGRLLTTDTETPWQPSR